MATMQQVNPATMQQVNQEKQATSTWSLVFPPEQKTVQQSAMLVKKLLAVGISTITYLRTVFPEGSYHDQQLDGLQLKLLIDNSKCQASNDMVSWLRGCFEAIDNKYLRQLTFAVLNKENHQEAYETYTYKFRYSEHGPIMTGPGTSDISLVTAQDIRLSTAKMLRSILLLTQSMKPLPKNLCLSMKLGYYDEVTPLYYEPPCFSANEEDYTFKSKPLTIKVGNVSTKFHAVRLHVCVSEEVAYLEDSPSEVQAEEEYQEEVEKGDVSCSDIVRSYNKVIPHQSTTNQPSTSAAGSQDVPLTCSQKNDHIVPTQSLVSSGIKSSHSGTMPLFSQEAAGRSQSFNSESEESKDFPVRCPCGVPYDDGLMIMCDICKKWQHGVCFNVLEDSEVRGSHVCEECATPSQPCADPSLPQQTELVTFCLFRRALVLLKQNKTGITAASLAQQLCVDITVGNQLISLLSKEKVVYTKKRKICTNRPRLLKTAFPKYLMGHGGSPGESQQTVDNNSQTPQSYKSTVDLDPDATPDLELSSIQESIIKQETGHRTESLYNSQDETVDIMCISQDVTIGTHDPHLSSKPCFEASQNNTLSEELTTIDNSLLLDSPPISQKTQIGFPSNMSLHSGMDVEEGSTELLQESSEDPRDQQCKVNLVTKPKRGRGRPKRLLCKVKKLSDTEISTSLASDKEMKNVISQDSEVSKKKKRARQ